MNLKQLEYVIEISKCGSINKAAQNLYVAQPSLSTAIKQLEQELKFNVFRRKNSGIELTSEGKMLLLSAKLIISEAERIRRIPLLFDSQKNLSICGTWSSLLMCSFMQFRNEFPEASLQDNIKETSIRQAIRDVMDQTYRLSIVSCLDSRRSLYHLEMQKYHIKMTLLAVNVPPVAVVSMNHYLSRFRAVTTAQLKTCPIVAYDTFNSDDWLGAFGLDSSCEILNIFDRGALQDAIRHNYVAILPMDPDLEQSIPNIVMRRISDGPMSSIYILHQISYPLNPREKKFIARFQARLDSIYGSQAR
ncbi:LysR family transcriptional regulator [uncultured Pyramidobacter sp.]|uniref:LysR family transcriptional regulator n=1 Tax=uncultured Pyramidobacter sp. TaxID=1623495 RepID=UPI002588FC16|nr:LysR family transcriptional regulator [uncultured Pyramidobacter sp.]